MNPYYIMLLICIQSSHCNGSEVNIMVNAEYAWKSNTQIQILNKLLGSISTLKDPQNWACEKHFFPLFSLILITEILFHFLVADKI